MEISRIIFGGFAGFVGVMMLLAVLSSAGVQPTAMRVAVAIFGINGLLFGVLHLSQGLGLAWATSGLRAKVFTWTIVPCLVSWLCAWTIQEKESRRKRSLPVAHADKRLLKPVMLAIILA